MDKRILGISYSDKLTNIYFDSKMAELKQRFTGYTIRVYYDPLRDAPTTKLDGVVIMPLVGNIPVTNDQSEFKQGINFCYSTEETIVIFYLCVVNLPRVTARISRFFKIPKLEDDNWHKQIALYVQGNPEWF